MVRPGLSQHFGKIFSGLSTMSVSHFEKSPSHKWFLCAQSLVCKLLTCWVHWASCRSHATIVLLFGTCSTLLWHGFVFKQACFSCTFFFFCIILNLQEFPIFFKFIIPSRINYQSPILSLHSLSLLIPPQSYFPPNPTPSYCTHVTDGQFFTPKGLSPQIHALPSPPVLGAWL